MESDIFTRMISVEKATEIVLSQSRSFGTEEISFVDALGRVLASDHLADTDLPPFDRVMMDGIAIRKESFDNGQRSFRIESMQQAGEAKKKLSDSSHAVEIMTGAILPHGANAVIPYEQITIEEGAAHLQLSEVKLFQNVHLKGSDKKKDDVLVCRHTKLSAAELAIAASVGSQKLQVLKLPRIHIFSTGNELIEVDEVPLEHQIRRSNVYAVQQLLRSLGIASSQSHIPDDYDVTKLALTESLRTNDVVIMTGGVSKGKYDLVPKVLEECGVQKLFHSISQRPGKPMWFGTKNDKTVFAFPGNPVSTYMCAVRYLLPYLRKCLYQPSFEEIYLRLDSDFSPHSALTFFTQAKMYFDKNGIAWATPTTRNGSGDFSSLANGDVFLEIPPASHHYLKGYVAKAFSYRNIL